MKIRLTAYIPVDPVHGLTKGKVLDVLRTSDKGGVFVRSDAGGEVRVLNHEYEAAPEESDVTSKA